jgi:CMP-N-acetylneuraminic acid synthetase
MNAEPVLAVVPARGGSKGVPRKNIRPLAGKPLLAYTLEAARAAARISRLVVSTDDEEIAAAARQWGADVPFLRPPHLADDAAPQVEVVLHALQTVEALEQAVYPYVVLLQPTAPLRSPGDIDASLDLLISSGCDSVVSYCRVEREHPYYMATLEDGRPRPVLEVPPGLTARQQYPAVYLRNGAVYAARREVLLERRSFYGTDVRAYVMPSRRSINIDTLFDLELAEFLLARSEDDPDSAANSEP